MLTNGRGRLVLSRAAESAYVQTVAVIAATLLIGAWHWQNDGLWFQGDAPRHAATGFLYWDLLTTLPRHPVAYALSYYARYPVIVAGVYPPLFHIVEGVAFAVAAPSAYVAKTLVLAYAGLAGIYTALWGRRWIAPIAGWAGACLILMPGFVHFSNAVLPNVPAAALGLAALYHFHAWLETGRVFDRNVFIVLTVAAILTYYPGGLVLPIAATWMVMSRQRARLPVVAGLACVLAIAVAITAIVLPAHFARNAPSLSKVVSAVNWTFYGRALVILMGGTWCVLAGLGLAVGLVANARRREAQLLIVALASSMLCLALLPARDMRYALLLAPLLVLAAFFAVAAIVEAAGRPRAVVSAAVVTLLLLVSSRAALATRVHRVSGVEQVARYLETHGRSDAVLYSGLHEGVLGFYMRARDPGFERRLVLPNKLLYRYAFSAGFIWEETPFVASPDDVVALLQQRCGCRWVAIENVPDRLLTISERYLRSAVDDPAFEHVESFAITARPVTRIDLYRFVPVLAPAPPMDLTFPSFSSQVFRGVRPVPRRAPVTP